MFTFLESDPLLVKSKDGGHTKPATIDFPSEREKVISCFMRQMCMNIQYNKDILDRHNLLHLKRTHILHLSGHGMPNESLLVENGLGYTQELKSDTLKKILNSKESKLKIVFISMCYSERVARKFLNNGVKHVIAIEHGEKVKVTMAIE
eukprot:UN26746